MVACASTICFLVGNGLRAVPFRDLRYIWNGTQAVPYAPTAYGGSKPPPYKHVK